MINSSKKGVPLYRRKHFKKPMCPEHNLTMNLMPSKYGQFYSCPLYPICDVTHGTHPNGAPLGFPADRETRVLRVKLHELCGKYWDWKNKQERNEMYRFLKKYSKHGHISMMDKDEIKALINLLELYDKPTNNS